MTDFAALLHMHIVSGSDTDKEGIIGAHGWFFGRFPTWEKFKTELTDHIESMDYVYFECEKLLEIDGIDDLNEGEQQELYRNLDCYPIQYRTIHRYRKDDT